MEVPGSPISADAAVARARVPVPLVPVPVPVPEGVFVLRAPIEPEAFEILARLPVEVATSSASGRDQLIHLRPTCHGARWSVYSGPGPLFRLLSVATLADPATDPRDIHVFTESKRLRLTPFGSTPAARRYYGRRKRRPEESRARREAVLAGR